MIVFDLQCTCGALFEGWFRDHADFDQQSAAGLLACPVCSGHGSVRKVLSPVIYRKGTSTAVITKEREAAEESTGGELSRLLDQALHGLHRFVERNFENVGAEFTVRSLKMHYGVEEAKNIRGVVTPAEEELLRREGIDFVKIPFPDKNEDGSQ
ncbi:MAG: DUF1178 family protein [Thermodesulfobacteriota bacterium]